MNYRHAYHAGNFADVLKHAVLALCLEHLKKKPSPFRVVDTHAGAGLYQLDARETEATGEWRDGIGRLFGATDRVFGALKPYLDEVARVNGGAGSALTSYPGSPVLTAGLLRAGDTLIANELQPDDNKRLAKSFASDRQVKVMALDGWIALKSTLPPPEKRGLVLIDPPFEQPGEFQRLAEGLKNGLDRFRSGIYVLWYPIKDPKPVQRFQRTIAEVAGRAGIETALALDLLVRAPRHPEVLNGCGVLVINPPHTLERDIAPLGPALARLLQQGPGAELICRRLVLNKDGSSS